MSPSRRRRTGTYRPPRDRREIVVAVLCALGVLVVTVALLFVLRPRDDDGPDVPPVSPPTAADRPIRSRPSPSRPTPSRPRPSGDTAPAPRRRDTGGGRAACRLRGGARLPPRPLPAPGARRPRRRPVGARGRADRVGQDARRRVRGRSARSPPARKAFYTTPLKALSNQKFGDLPARTAPAGSACSPATTPSTARRRSS